MQQCIKSPYFQFLEDGILSDTGAFHNLSHIVHFLAGECHKHADQNGWEIPVHKSGLSQTGDQREGLGRGTSAGEYAGYLTER